MKLFLMYFLLTTTMLSAQIITSEPVFTTQIDSIIIYYDATEGDQGLMGYSGNDVYAHTGVITTYSESSADWKHVIAEWNQNIPKAQLTRIATDYYRLVIGYPRDYYSMSDPSEEILQLAFVFRNGNRSVTGRDVGGTNILYDLYEPGLTVILLEPDIDDSFGNYSPPYFTDTDDTVSISAMSVTLGTDTDSLDLYIADDLIYSTSNNTLTYDFISSAYEPDIYPCHIIGKDTSGLSDTIYFNIAINPPVTDASRPASTIDGINYDSNTQVTLSLFAPYKSFIYVVGDFNDWKVNTSFYMNKEEVDADSIHWWITIDGLIPGEEYAFQYLVDGSLRIADPYTEKVLDPWHDQEIIDSGIYPNLKAYPAGKTTEPVAIIQTNQTPFTWVYSDTFARPAQHELVIYELLVRDFIENHDYVTLIDTLDYLAGLGINAIELMPVNEFEGNRSWGYNPSFYFAPDKYYGPLNDLKKFIDECHGRGIAVILDMVLNHSFGQSPLVRLYANEQGWPSSENPWYNADYDPTFDGYQARHPWNVGYDFNHNSLETRKLVDRVNNYWLETYRIDGFRFDLAKGLTQDGSHYHGGGNYSDNSDYDLGRVAILERMADKIWETDSTAYVILEHFTANDEEVDLSEYKKGMMLWGNLNYNYNEATMGYNENGKSDFSWGYYKKRLWNKPHLVTFMESHDEERLMFKNLTFGNSSGTYDIKMLEIALNRIKMAASFFFTYPGPKMFWQFGELGYDISIDDPCRVCDKPVLWNYYQEDFRNRLYKTFAALIKLRRSVPAFSSADATVDLSVSSATKRIRIGHSSMNVIIIGNFDVVDREIDPGFYYGGTWYDYFSGNPINVTDTNAEIPLEPGEFHIYTDKKLPTPEYDIINDILDKVPINGSYFLDQNYPNPFNPTTTINFEVAESSHVSVKVFDIIGREIIELVNEKKGPGSYKIKWNGKDSSGISVSSGVFIYEIKATSGGKMVFHQSRKMVLIR